MRQLRIDRTRQRRLQFVDALGNISETSCVCLGISSAHFVTNDVEPLSQHRGKIDNYVFHL